ncbi:MAG: polysaccharide biosynthesis protein [Acholeplasmataceae bacterium]|nr:polysaccharide biosynthesis protein [Acholeplasmataceae bacterium]
MKKKKRKYWRLLIKIEMAILDSFLMVVAYFATVFVSHRLGYQVQIGVDLTVSLILILISISLFAVFGVYRILISHIGFEDLIRITSIVIIKNSVFATFFFFVKQIEFLQWPMFLFIAPLEISLLIFPRIIPKIIKYLKVIFSKRHYGIRTLIVGAGSGGTIVLKEINQNEELNNKVVGFVDDDSAKIGSKLNGIQIYGPIKSIVSIIEELAVKEVIIAIANLSPKALSNIVKELTEANVRSKKIHVLSDLNAKSPVQLVDVNIEDLLKREPVELDLEGLKQFLENQTILVTGGGGSIGSELCRQIVDYQPERLIIFDIYENSTYDTQMDLKRKFYKNSDLKEPIIEVIIGSVYNYERLKSVFETYRPNIVFHAAAYKHVPLMEDSAVEAIRTNIVGTYNVATLADEFEVKKMVLVSTDKAVRPTNIMGASKRYAEHIILYQNSISKNTSYSAVRFGNVLGSSGSVIPLFQKQISDGGPVTVTHRDITRYFMTISEAVSLILLSGFYAKGSEIFVLDMGEPVKISDLAEKMIKLAGYRPNIDISIEYSGLRPGEKLFEEILIDTNLDIHKPTPNAKIFVENKSFLTFEQLKIAQIINSIDNFTNEEAKEFIKTIIKTYTIFEINNKN